MTSIRCPACGLLDLSLVQVYQESLRRQTFRLLPVLPTCRQCGQAVAVTFARQEGLRALLLNGTCGSGKSSVAEALMELHGFAAIDGDCAMQVVRHKQGVRKVHEEALFAEILLEARLFMSLGQDVVIAHVVMPADLPRYREALAALGYRVTVVMLRPSLETALARCQTRTCHTSVTPPYWVQHFHEALRTDGAAAGVHVHDNAGETVRETADAVWKLSRPAGR